MAVAAIPGVTVNMLEAVKSVLSHYATLTGRAQRSEYWYWALFSGILQGAAIYVDLSIGGSVCQWTVILLTVLPSFAVGVRRLHDIGKTGWFQLLSFIPILGWLILFIWSLRDSQPRNIYGPNPKRTVPVDFGPLYRY